VFILQGKDASKLEGNWFQLLMVLFTKEYLPTSVPFEMSLKKTPRFLNMICIHPPVFSWRAVNVTKISLWKWNDGTFLKYYQSCKKKNYFVEHVNNFQSPYKIFRFVTNPTTLSNNCWNCNKFLGWLWTLRSRGWLSAGKLGLDPQNYDLIKEL